MFRYIVNIDYALIFCDFPIFFPEPVEIVVSRCRDMG